MVSVAQNPLQPVDEAYSSASEEDRQKIRVILVMGLTGTGKSTFIKRLTNDRKIVVGNSLQSQTTDVTLSRVDVLASDNKPYTLYLADTPGFDEISRSDTDVLINIVTSLQTMRKEHIKLSGIIYLHRITDTRIGGAASRNLRMLHELVGTDKMKNVLFVSNRWEERPQNDPDVWRVNMEERQTELEQRFWKTYIRNGARVMRHDGSRNSARRIVDNIIAHSTPMYIQVQEEVHAGKDLSETAAGQAIKTDLEKDAEKMKEELSQLKSEMEEVLKDSKEGNDQLKQAIQEDISSIKKKLGGQLEALEKLALTNNLKLQAGLSLAVIFAIGIGRVAAENSETLIKTLEVLMSNFQG